MAGTSIIDPLEVRQLFDYDPISGELVWKRRPLEHFKNAHGFNIWNAKNEGRIAGYASQNYWSVRINGRAYLAHRVVWAWCHGEWPTEEIDHVNGMYRDNRIDNLRTVSRAENARNLPRKKLGKSGIRGVIAINGRWRASISVANKTVYLGTFDNVSDAVAARKEAEVRYGFHENHGALALA